MECALNPLIMTFATLVSYSNYICFGRISKTGGEELFEIIAKTVRTGLPLQRSCYVHMSLKLSTKVLQPSVWEACISSRFSWRSSKIWSLNEKSTDASAIWDWRGRCLMNQKLTPVTGMSPEISQNTGATSLFCEPKIASQQTMINVSKAAIFYVHFWKASASILTGLLHLIYKTTTLSRPRDYWDYLIKYVARILKLNNQYSKKVRRVL